MSLRYFFLLALFALVTPVVAAEKETQSDEDPRGERIEVDVCVYGGTSGGVVAAVQAARMGKRVVLVEPGRHLGGMTSGGLSAVDIGEPRSVGGIAREYFTRLVAEYGKRLNWGEGFDRGGKGGPATGGAYSIEPHVAEKVFDEMAAETGVTVLKEAELNSLKLQHDKASPDQRRIVELRIGDGRAVRAKMFIDATYEGDLMGMAGVTYTLNREANAQYGEQYNGIHYAEKYRPRTDHLQPGPNGRVKGGQGVWDRDFPLDPYVVKGDPSSGMLALVDAGEPGVAGELGPGVQAYCFRLCLTTDKANSIPIEPPSDYDPKRYELVARFIDACLDNGDDMDLRWFSKYDPLPADKWDFNTATFGGNLPGENWQWPIVDHDRRAVIAKKIENYHRGLFQFLRTDPRVPEKVKRDLARFGLPRDEFTDNGGWPHQIYVREGRRMVSDFVMTEHHTFGREVVPKPIGLGSYGTDAHEIRRIVKDGVVIREGKIATGRGGFGPYGIGYMAIVPKAEECENLLVPFALSASHTAFASIRMEPVFMATSQSAATAACQAIDAGVAVQDVDYEALKQRLIVDGQVLEWEGNPPRIELSGIVIDDDDAQLAGSWVKSNAAGVLVGSSYRHDGGVHDGRKTAAFVPDIPETGDYEVRLLYSHHENRASNANVYIDGADGRQIVKADQRQPCLVDGVPRSLGVFRFEKGSAGKIIVTNHGTDGYVAVDGIQVVAAKKEAAARPGKASRWTGDRIAPAANAVALAEVDGRSFDLVVIEATPAGVACAVRAAREGLNVLLVDRTGHLGGILSSGLGVWDTLWEGKRSPIYDQLRESIFEYYRLQYGEESPQYRHALPGKSGHTNGKFEPRVAEGLITTLVEAEPNLTVVTGCVPVSVQRSGRLLESVTLRDSGGARKNKITVKAAAFADCTYEGDLLPLAEVEFRIGRESRDEFDEPHAGRIYLRPTKQRPGRISEAQWQAHQALDLRQFPGFQEIVEPDSTGKGDWKVQAYNYRTILTSDPDNRLPVTKPAKYDPEFLKTLEYQSIVQPLPNRKIGWNRPQLVGPHQDWVECSWHARQDILDAHWNATMALLYFMQHDESVPQEKRTFWLELGLPKDEFADNDHRPYEIYVREARRLVGRYTLTQHDLMPVPGTIRPPQHADAIAMTDWYMDSHAVTRGKVDGSLDEGKMMLHAETWPGQIPWRCLLPKGVDNLVVPVCLSTTHVAWGAVRLEPTWMQTGESAGLAVALAKKAGTTPGALDARELVGEVVKIGSLVDFYTVPRR